MRPASLPGWVTQRMLVQSGLEVRLLLGKSLQNLYGMIDRPQFRQELASRWAQVHASSSTSS